MGRSYRFRFLRRRRDVDSCAAEERVEASVWFWVGAGAVGSIVGIA